MTTWPYITCDSCDSIDAFGAKSEYLARMLNAPSYVSDYLLNESEESQESQLQTAPSVAHSTTCRFSCLIACLIWAMGHEPEAGAGEPALITPASPYNPSRARIGPSPRYRASTPGSANPGSPLPTRSESLPTGLRLIETPLPWPQGRIPATYLVPGLPRTTSYRTPACQPGEGVTVAPSVGDGEGVVRKLADSRTWSPLRPDSGHPFRPSQLVSSHKP